MRKMILMAIAGYLWKKYKAHNGHAGTKSSGAAGHGPAAAATATSPAART